MNDGWQWLGGKVFVHEMKEVPLSNSSGTLWYLPHTYKS